MKLTIDPAPQAEKIEKRWDPYEDPSKDPNWDVNIIRAEYGLPPEDGWNIGVKYVWNGMYPLNLHSNS